MVLSFLTGLGVDNILLNPVFQFSNIPSANFYKMVFSELNEFEYANTLGEPMLPSHAGDGHVG
jgi:hypothetical protein